MLWFFHFSLYWGLGLNIKAHVQGSGFLWFEILIFSFRAVQNKIEASDTTTENNFEGDIPAVQELISVQRDFSFCTSKVYLIFLTWENVWY